MASRHIDDMLPHVANKFHELVLNCQARGVNVLIYCTYRSPEEQEAEYAKGRTAAGRITTNARAWQSWHQYRRAADLVPMLNGKPVWEFHENDPHWKVVIEEADRLGIEWAGRWKTFKEFVHFQITDGKTMEQARKDL